MRYAIKDLDTGRYVKGESAWSRSGTEYLHKSKLWHREADALAHMSKAARWAGQRNFTVVEVAVFEVVE